MMGSWGVSGTDPEMVEKIVQNVTGVLEGKRVEIGIGVTTLKRRSMVTVNGLGGGGRGGTDGHGGERRRTVLPRKRWIEKGIEGRVVGTKLMESGKEKENTGRAHGTEQGGGSTMMIIMTVIVMWMIVGIMMMTIGRGGGGATVGIMKTETERGKGRRDIGTGIAMADDLLRLFTFYYHVFACLVFGFGCCCFQISLSCCFMISCYLMLATHTHFTLRL
ncbi:hypothetical protein QBC35DRAFT_213373 [Podospora australis]|uniref:Uncharacterized protein n=1 Tax=Podospora australis TaxID=1536484 RepID=A0AAN6WX04_9PEZI|nr:hypothetical protein QBC35DRAFT_213373 [Podospora australis]